ncbi:hypothetical protein H8A97_38500 [Bradyrhizobium sp. Arg62]|uniref:YybH family protein n=1 Tax=Bradyrhizobium TaxID=374 RepID=UPI003558FB3C|nr:hypothetical protein [Bradyrhizobium ivorense]MCC8950802.1 hypothetical protein [Bradyrhizobium brasilense]
MQREAQALVDEWAQVFNTGRPTDLARFYTHDARIVPPGRPTVVGVEAICTFFGDIWAQGFRDYAVGSLTCSRMTHLSSRRADGHFADRAAICSSTRVTG